MSNRNKIILLVLLIAVIALPYWRVKSNSKFFVDGVINHLENMGVWNHSSVEVSLDGNVKVLGVQFIPNGFKQAMNIDSVNIHVDMRRLLFSSPHKLTTHVPNNLTISFNNVSFEHNSSDFQKAAEQQNYWPVAVGYLGAYGCGTGAEPNYTSEQWDEILPTAPQFNIELNYSLVDSYHIDFNLNIESDGNWYIVWSGTLTRTSDVDLISFHDTIIEKLYYHHADMGFNQKRNEFCAQQNNESFSAYRVNSAEEIQTQLRVYHGKEMPSLLSNQYQRSLAEGIEINAIFDLSEPKYIYEFADLKQKDFFEQSQIEAAFGENDYKKIDLADIDFLELDMETLRAELEAKEQEAKRLEAEANAPKELLKTIKHTVGGESPNEIVIKDWNEAIGENIRVRTKRGRPIFGRLLSVNDTHLTIATRYMRGDATISVAKKDVVRMTKTR
ncbi:MAG: hypothetical protein R3E90_07430 [Marinicella sp.]|nr:hypothetical protein [Xanthomonadales bacterium]